MTYIVAIFIVLASIALGFVLSLLRKPNVKANSPLVRKFETVSTLKDQLEYRILLENADDKQAAALAAAMNTVFGITSVGIESAEMTIDAAAVATDRQITNSEDDLRNLIG
jgi:hypothetical protein